MPFFDGVRGRVYYRHWAATHPVAQVVFLHGYGEHSGMYHRFGDQLTRRGLGVWAPDAIGHGLSDGPRGDPGPIDALRANAEVMTRIARETRSDLPIALVGSSMGAVTAASLAATRRESFAGVVLAGPPLDGVTPDRERAIAESVWSLDPFYLDELENDPLRPDPSLAFQVLLSVLSPGVCGPIAAALRDLSIPVLIVSGEIDAFCPPDRPAAWAAPLQHGRSHVFAGGHHDVINDTMHEAVGTLIGDAVLEWTGGRASRPVR